MAKVIFLRHGEPDYSKVTQLRYKGHGRDLAQLSENGVRQAQSVAEDTRLKGAELILSSPYTRALQTAAIISKENNLDMAVVTELHEWLPDLTFSYDSEITVQNAAKSLTDNKGECPEHYQPKYETLESVFNRVKSSLLPYLKYDKIIVVCHGFVMRQFKYVPNIEYCGILEVEVDENFKWGGFVEH